MAADRKQVNTLLFRTDHIFSVCLNGIHMVQRRRILCLDDPGDFLYRLHSAHLIVYIHGRNQNGIRTDCLFKFLQADVPVMVYRKNGHFKAKLFQHAQRIVYRRMLNCRADDMLTGSLICPCRTDQSHIVGLRAAGGKQDFLFLYLHAVRDDFSCLADILLCFHALAVLGSRIAIVLCHCFYHNILHAVQNSCGC